MPGPGAVAAAAAEEAKLAAHRAEDEALASSSTASRPLGSLANTLSGVGTGTRKVLLVRRRQSDAGDAAASSSSAAAAAAATASSSAAAAAAAGSSASASLASTENNGATAQQQQQQQQPLRAGSSRRLLLAHAIRPGETVRTAAGDTVTMVNPYSPEEARRNVVPLAVAARATSSHALGGQADQAAGARQDHGSTVTFQGVAMPPAAYPATPVRAAALGAPSGDGGAPGARSAEDAWHARIEAKWERQQHAWDAMRSQLASKSGRQTDDLVMNRGAAFRQKRMMLTLLEEARRRESAVDGMWENSLRGGAGEGFVQLGGHPIFAPRPKKKLPRSILGLPLERGVSLAQNLKKMVQQGKLRLTSKAIVEHHTQVLQRGAAGAQQRGSWPQHDQEQAHNESITSDVAFAADEHVDSDMGRGAATEPSVVLLSVSSQSVFLETDGVGAPCSGAVVLENVGTTRVSYAVRRVPGAATRGASACITCAGADGVLAPGARTRVRFFFTPASAGRFADVFEVSSLPASAQRLRVSVSGMCTLADTHAEHRAQLHATLEHDANTAAAERIVGDIVEHVELVHEIARDAIDGVLDAWVAAHSARPRHPFRDAFEAANPGDAYFFSDDVLEACVRVADAMGLAVPDDARVDYRWRIAHLLEDGAPTSSAAPRFKRGQTPHEMRQHRARRARAPWSGSIDDLAALVDALPATAGEPLRGDTLDIGKLVRLRDDDADDDDADDDDNDGSNVGGGHDDDGEDGGDGDGTGDAATLSEAGAALASRLREAMARVRELARLTPVQRGDRLVVAVVRDLVVALADEVQSAHRAAHAEVAPPADGEANASPTDEQRAAIHEKAVLAVAQALSGRLGERMDALLEHAATLRAWRAS